MIKILFVCLGNICRSPLAEAIFNDKVKKSHLSQKLSSDSAGTSTYHIGEDPDSRSIEAAVNHGIPIAHKGRQIRISDNQEFEYILAMDQSNYKNIVNAFGFKPEGLYLMRDFDLQAKGADVPDPYYGGKDGFENVYQILDRSIDEFMSFIKERHNL